MKKAIIAGASGLTGSKLMHLLLQNSSYERVYILVRRHLNITHRKLVQILVDYECLEAEHLPVGIDEAFCCLGTKRGHLFDNFYKMEFEYITRFAKASEIRGIQTFHLISAIWASPYSPFFNQKIKGEAECFVTSLDIPAVVVYRPSLICGSRQYRAQESIAFWVSNALGFLFIGKLKRVKAITGDQMAEAMCGFSCQCKPGRWVLESEEISKMCCQAKNLSA